MRKNLIFILLVYSIIFFYSISTINFNKSHSELHKGYKTRVVAHRGYSSLARENSLKSIEIANNSDCVDMLEIDIRLTKDNVLILSHNNKILKIGNKKFNVSNTTYDMIKQFRLIDNYYLPLKKDDEYFEFVSIPTLKEALKKIDKEVIIDIKYNNNISKLNNKLLSIVDEFDNVILQSTSLKGLNDIHEKNNLMKCQLIIDSRFDYINVPDYLYGISVKHTMLDETEIKKITDRGTKLFVWTINDLETFKKVLNTLKNTSRIAYYITDYPELLCTYDKEEFLTF